MSKANRADDIATATIEDFVVAARAAGIVLDDEYERGLNEYEVSMTLADDTVVSYIVRAEDEDHAAQEATEMNCCRDDYVAYVGAPQVYTR